MFDVIVLHRVWSWISAANRAVIFDGIRMRLAPDRRRLRLYQALGELF